MPKKTESTGTGLESYVAKLMGNGSNRTSVTEDEIQVALKDIDVSDEQLNAVYSALRNSGIQIRCVDAGWALSNLPVNPSQRNVFDQVASQHPVQGELCTVPQVNGIDTTDRITIGAALLRDFIAAGL